MSTQNQRGANLFIRLSLGTFIQQNVHIEAGDQHLCEAITLKIKKKQAL